MSNKRYICDDCGKKFDAIYKGYEHLNSADGDNCESFREIYSWKKGEAKT